MAETKYYAKQMDFDDVVENFFEASERESAFPLSKFMPISDVDEFAEKSNIAIYWRAQQNCSEAIQMFFNYGYYRHLELRLQGILDAPYSLERRDRLGNDEEQAAAELIKELNELIEIPQLKRQRRDIKRPLSGSELVKLSKLMQKGRFLSEWDMKDAENAITEVIAPLYYAEDGQSFVIGDLSTVGVKEKWSVSYRRFAEAAPIRYFGPAEAVSETALNDFRAFIFCTGEFYSLVSSAKRLDSGSPEFADVRKQSTIAYFPRCIQDFGGDQAAYDAKVREWAAKRLKCPANEIEILPL